MFPTRSSVWRTICYAAPLLLSLAIMGSFSEGCALVERDDVLGSCPSRMSVVIAFSAGTALFTLILTAMSMLGFGPKIGELALAFLAFACSIVVCAITTSPRTIKRYSNPLDSSDSENQFVNPLDNHFLLAWACLLFLTAALITALADKDDEDDYKRPSSAYNSPTSPIGSNPATHKAGAPAV